MARTESTGRISGSSHYRPARLQELACHTGGVHISRAMNISQSTHTDRAAPTVSSPQPRGSGPHISRSRGQDPRTGSSARTPTVASPAELRAVQLETAIRKILRKENTPVPSLLARTGLHTHRQAQKDADRVAGALADLAEALEVAKLPDSASVVSNEIDVP